MIKRPVFAVLMLALLLPASCADESKIQDKFKGLWILETRTLPDGTVLRSPEVSACVEWFESEPLLGHLTWMVTYGLHDTQFLGANYDLAGETSFTRRVYNEVGGGIRVGYEPGYVAPGPTDKGSIETPGSHVVLRHADGTLFDFSGSTLTVTHADGTVDVLKK